MKTIGRTAKHMTLDRDRKISMSYAVRRWVKEAVDVLADMKGVSQSVIIDDALEQYISKQKDKLTGGKKQ